MSRAEAEVAIDGLYGVEDEKGQYVVYLLVVDLLREMGSRALSDEGCVRFAHLQREHARKLERLGPVYRGQPDHPLSKGRR